MSLTSCRPWSSFKFCSSGVTLRFLDALACSGQLSTSAPCLEELNLNANALGSDQNTLRSAPAMIGPSWSLLKNVPVFVFAKTAGRSRPSVDFRGPAGPSATGLHPCSKILAVPLSQPAATSQVNTGTHRIKARAYLAMNNSIMVALTSSSFQRQASNWRTAFLEGAFGTLWHARSRRAWNNIATRGCAWQPC